MSIWLLKLGCKSSYCFGPLRCFPSKAPSMLTSPGSIHPLQSVFCRRIGTTDYIPRGAAEPSHLLLVCHARLRIKTHIYAKESKILLTEFKASVSIILSFSIYAALLKVSLAMRPEVEKRTPSSSEYILGAYLILKRHGVINDSQSLLEQTRLPVTAHEMCTNKSKTFLLIASKLGRSYYQKTDTVWQ